MKAFYLVIFVYGQAVHTSTWPMTADECTLQAAYNIVQIEQYAASGRPVPDEFGGPGVTLDDVEVKCLRKTDGGNWK